MALVFWSEEECAFRWERRSVEPATRRRASTSDGVLLNAQRSDLKRFEIPNGH